MIAAATLLSAAFIWLGTGLHPIWWLTWIAALPILLVAPKVSAGTAARMAFVAWALGSCNNFPYLYTTLHLPLWLAIWSSVGGALVFAMAVRYWRRSKGIRAAILFAGIWVVYEFLRYRLSIHSTWDNLAYSQVNSPHVIQLAALTGVMGISFVVLFLQALIATRQSHATALAIFTAASLFAYSHYRLQTDLGPTWKVALATSDQPPDLTRYAIDSQALLARGAKVVVLPEKTKKITDADLPAIDAQFGAASQNGLIALGLERWTALDLTHGAKRNETRLYDHGHLRAIYEKQHMLPPFEDHLLVGHETVAFPYSDTIVGTAICKDMTFPSLGCDYGKAHAGLMLIPAWDFTEDAAYSDRIAVLRGVENGYSILRAPREGNLIASNALGQIQAEIASGSKPFVTLETQLPVRHFDTLYTQWGDWLLYPLALLLVWAYLPLHFRPAPR